MLKKVIRALYLRLYHLGIFNFIPNKAFIKFQYKMATGEKLHLDAPVTFNEKIQWIKLYDKNPIYTDLVDKFKVRDFVKTRIGAEYLIPLLGKWDKVSDIDIDKLPECFVLKCNHDSGGIVICTDKNNFDWNAGKKKLKKHLKQNHFYLSREWAYKNVKPCIIAEKYMIDNDSQDLRDYKFFCFNGIPKLIQVDFNRFIDHKRNLYTIDWEFIDLTIKCPNDPNADIPKPINLDEMIEIAKKLSHGFPEVRVDLYSINGKTYFGEMTLYHGGGYEKFTPEIFGRKMGDMIDLSLSYGGKT